MIIGVLVIKINKHLVQGCTHSRRPVARGKGSCKSRVEFLWVLSMELDLCHYSGA